MSRREFKSGVFTMLQEEPENALDVYNVLNGTNYTDPGLITIQKLDGRILLSVRNDASFLIDSFFNMYEHQSTFNPNMPLRFTIYFSDWIKRFVDERNYNLYGTKQIPIPTPKFVVFYNGTKDRPAREVFRLSDAYEHPCEDYELELMCTVYNINPGYNEDILAKSKVLRGYTTFVEKVRGCQKLGENLENALNRAMDECIEEGILVDFFTRRREELLENGYLDFTFERQLELTARDSREEGLERGLERGRSEGLEQGRSEGLERGRREGRIKAIARICKKGLSIQETSEMLEEDENLVREIYELADRYPEEDAGKLYERYEEERGSVTFLSHI